VIFDHAKAVLAGQLGCAVGGVAVDEDALVAVTGRARQELLEVLALVARRDDQRDAQAV
jgi:hypothetical protein